jgi:hypothetical protein
MQLPYGFRQYGRSGEGSRARREGGKCEMPMSRSRRMGGHSSCEKQCSYNLLRLRLVFGLESRLL